jgi:hypothetical protein
MKILLSVEDRDFRISPEETASYSDFPLQRREAKFEKSVFPVEPNDRNAPGLKNFPVFFVVYVNIDSSNS